MAAASRSNHTPAVVSASEARRLLMDAQGLLADPTRRPGPAALYKLIQQMGFVQLDTITIVERAHHHILATRLDGYRPDHLESLHHKDRRLFEHMTHDASLIPTVWYPHWRHRFARVAWTTWISKRLGDNPQPMLDSILARIRDRGPSMSRHIEHNGHPRDSGISAVGVEEAAGAGERGWWEWRPSKAALEFLWRSGRLAVASRENFQKVYDLAERVLPEAHARPMPTDAEHLDWACSTALDRLGVATPAELAAFWHAVKPAHAAAWCRDAVASAAAIRVTVESADGSPPRPALAVPDWRNRLKTAPLPPDRVRLLSPFDPIIRDRRRALRLFNLDYRFEAFVPRAKRTHGYYVLPVLRGDRFIARLDPKLHRDRALLEIKKLWWEPGVNPTRRLLAELDEGITRFAKFIGADQVSMPRNPARTPARAPTPPSPST